MRRSLLASLALVALMAGAAHARGIDLGVYGGTSLPLLQEDANSGTLYGIRLPLKFVPLISVEPFYAKGKTTDKSTTVNGASYTRSGFDQTSYGVNAMFSFGGPISFFPYAGIGTTTLTRPGLDASYSTYDFGFGIGLSVIPKFPIQVRGEVQALVDGQASRKFATVTAGVSHSLFSMP